MKYIRTLFSETMRNWLGFSIGVVGFGLAIYATFFNDQSPSLRYSILSDINVVEVREDVGRLEVTYAGQNLRRAKRSLRIYTVRIVNDGRARIPLSDYDPRSPLGVGVGGGQFVERPRLLAASSEYLTRNLVMHQASPQEILFDPVIIEPGDYLAIRLLVLHDVSAMPKLVPIGKIGGVRKIVVDPPYKPSEKESGRGEIWGGGLGVQIVRSISYPFLLVLLSLGVAFPTSLASDGISKLFRRRRTKRYLASLPIRTNWDQLLCEFYDTHGMTLITVLESITDVTGKRGVMFPVPGHSLENVVTYQSVPGHPGEVRLIYPAPGHWLAEQMLEQGLLVRNVEVPTQYSVNSGAADSVARFLRFLGR